ncbi:hypothetical protein K2X05_07245 [bacterium]|nr:hypothetical protein [bacterium]
MISKLLLIIFTSVCGLAPQLFAANKEKNSLEKRIHAATLCVDPMKMPIAQGQVILVDSLFAIYKSNKSIGINDVHSSVILQIHDSGVGQRAEIVDYDIPSGVMWVQTKKQEIVAPKQKMSEYQVADLAVTYQMISEKEKPQFINLVKRFEQNNHLRGLAGSKSFPEMLEVQMKNYGDKLTQTLLKSQRKMSWTETTPMPLPLVDSCEVDSDFFKKIKKNTNLNIELAFKCEVLSSQERNVAANLKPEYLVHTGMLQTEDAYLKTQNTAGQLELLGSQFDENIQSLLQDPNKCISHWISDRQIYVKSCVKRNEVFKGLYNGIHLFGFYHNKKVIYKAIEMNGFSDINQKEIVQKFLKEMKGNVL